MEYVWVSGCEGKPFHSQIFGVYIFSSGSMLV